MARHRAAACGTQEIARHFGRAAKRGVPEIERFEPGGLEHGNWGAPSPEVICDRIRVMIGAKGTSACDIGALRDPAAPTSPAGNAKAGQKHPPSSRQVTNRPVAPLRLNGHVAYSSGNTRLSADPIRLVLKGLSLAETGATAPLLELAAIEIPGARFHLGTRELVVPELAIRSGRAQATAVKDGSIDWAKLFTPGGSKPAQDKPAARTPWKRSAAVSRFKARIQRFQGSAAGISTDPKARASLKFAGQVDPFGEARVDGSLLPSDPARFTDIKVGFRNVAMSSLSPYSATFAGREIDAGKLNLDLEYKIKNGELLGTNQVVLREFTLGKPVKSDRAANLPLDLAVALLTDTEGKIDVAVPVSGNLDSPELSFGHVVGQAIANLIGKIVTAPFRALGSALGGGAAHLDSVAFAPGEPVLAPPEREKLKTLGQALTERPQLMLTVHPGFDPAVDGTAINDLNLRLALARELKVALTPGEDPGPVAYDEAKTQRALEKLAGKQGGDEAVDRFQAAYEKGHGREVKRVNAVLALVGKASEDREFYQAFLAHLVEQAPPPDAQLQALATQRATAVIDELTAGAAVDPSRVSAAAPERTSAKHGPVPSRLELGVRGGG